MISTRRQSPPPSLRLRFTPKSEIASMKLAIVVEGREAGERSQDLRGPEYREITSLTPALQKGL